MASIDTTDLGAEDQKSPNLLKRFEAHVQGKVVSGLIELVPLIVTVVILLFIIGHADSLVRSLGFVEGRPWDFPGIGLIVLGVVFYFIGLLATTGFGRTLLDWKSTILNHVPVVKTLYGVTQQAMVSVGSQYNFSRVVFVEWPKDGMVAMGFVTGRARSPGSGEDLVSLYIPTVPNPTSGNMAFVLEDDIVETDMTVEDAMKLIFSGGIVLPDNISMARLPVEKREKGAFIGRYERET